MALLLALEDGDFDHGVKLLQPHPIKRRLHGTYACCDRDPFPRC